MRHAAFQSAERERKSVFVFWGPRVSAATRILRNYCSNSFCVFFVCVHAGDKPRIRVARLEPVRLVGVSIHRIVLISAPERPCTVSIHKIKPIASSLSENVESILIRVLVLLIVIVAVVDGANGETRVHGPTPLRCGMPSWEKHVGVDGNSLTDSFDQIQTIQNRVQTRDKQSRIGCKPRKNKLVCTHAQTHMHHAQTHTHENKP